ncbi:MAG: hypothetical protein COU10_03655 [Candidatus Harrisonbacteria bacterium CG10_big_fil_rev_8_21_14_0_10_45_28]|uniref:Uncharacterized protein n=1 Tax=Candidatus Harrisonbacteria bacterium CG10_big_fil_rev_8_21_14_0_10_45_28 TaxID=1974586 RepID=A0A2H0UMJ3_9BACT|nr:MAG: hypothetical protein COU10_03655 [Candidatus Harrisonbacteria bacterium CG10_big_fil_rev_8_21_14_0_10_45_28]
MINAKQLARALQSMAKNEKSAEHVLDRFFSFVENYNLQGLLPNVLSELERVKKEDYKESALQVQSAHVLSSHDEKNIRGITGAQDAPLDFRLEKELLGGFRAKYKGVEYEGSFSRTVNKLEKELQV